MSIQQDNFRAAQLRVDDAKTELAEAERALVYAYETLSPDSYLADRATAEGEPCNARTWRLTAAGSWVYVNAEGTDIGNVYQPRGSGAWVGSPWGRTIANFETANEAKDHVEKMFRS